MWYGMIMVSAIAFFLAQLWCCFRCRRPWLRLLPMMVAAVLDVVCWVALLLSKSLAVEDSVGFAAAILGFYILVCLVMGTALAWGIYGAVKVAQKMAK